MTHDQPPFVPSQDLPRDWQIGNALLTHEATLVPDDLTVHRQRHRIMAAARARLAAARQAIRQPTWWEWVAMAARPLPIGVAAALFLVAVSVLRATPVESQAITTGDARRMAFSEVVVTGLSGSPAIEHILPASPDSLLARAFPAITSVSQ